MRSVGIKMLKNKLSEYIRLAARGETILVTDRDRVVAQITQPGASRADTVSDAVLAEAVRKGWVTPPVLKRPPSARKPLSPLAEILDELDRQRNDR